MNHSLRSPSALEGATPADRRSRIHGALLGRAWFVQA